MDEPKPGATIVLYDGVCALCNNAVTFILQHDPLGCIMFASLQGEFGTGLLLKAGLDPTRLDTLYLVQNYGTEKQRILERSDAALNIARLLNGGWRWLSLFLAVPRVLRNAGYDLIARNRYRLFGKHDQCVMPRKEWKARFID